MMKRSTLVVRGARYAAAVAAIAALAAHGAIAQADRAGTDWRVYGGDLGASKYSSLPDINAGNVARLTKLWEWSTGETPTENPRTRPGSFEATPLAIGDTLFVSTPYNRVVALDASTGRLLWAYDPKAYLAGQPPNGTGFVHRGVATWSDGRHRRVFMNSRWNLIALDASTGKPIRDFGDTGVVDLTARLGAPGHPVNRLHYTETSPPVVWHDLVIVGNGVADRLIYPNDPPGDVQAFDVHSGKRVWSFSPIPRDPEDPGVKTWQDSSWKTTGHANVWAPFSVDEDRGLLYLPVSTPSNDWYGGARIGDDLYAESIVCLDAKTGKRVWYYQLVHHGLWDYDLPAAPILATLHTGSGRDVVAVPTKQGFLFVFARASGEPIFPISEHATPPSNVPGEVASPSQPEPSMPKAFAKQGFSPADVIDFTPAIKARALDAIKDYQLGPLFTPPSMEGTIVMPGAIGGAGWGGGALDPATGTIYIKTTNQPALYKITQPAHSDTVDAAYTADLSKQSLRVTFPPGPDGQRVPPLPINKPPYGTMVAIDLSTGATRWNVPFGDTPAIRNHPLLKDVALPPLLGVAGSPGPIVTAGALLFATGGGATLYALDTRDGHTLWSADLGAPSNAVPMTFRTRAGKQLVVIATGSGSSAKLVAFGLPD